eukprot:1068234-Rhodomonas_salina.4
MLADDRWTIIGDGRWASRSIRPLGVVLCLIRAAVLRVKQVHARPARDSDGVREAGALLHTPTPTPHTQRELT